MVLEIWLFAFLMALSAKSCVHYRGSKLNRLRTWQDCQIKLSRTRHKTLMINVAKYQAIASNRFQLRQVWVKNLRKLVCDSRLLFMFSKMQRHTQMTVSQEPIGLVTSCSGTTLLRILAWHPESGVKLLWKLIKLFMNQCGFLFLYSPCRREECCSGVCTPVYGRVV